MLQASVTATGWLTARCQKMYGGCFISDGLCESYSSISMTACSSILAMGMMPLCLLIYTSVWTSADTIQIPYDSIGEHAHATALIGCHGCHSQLSNYFCSNINLLIVNVCLVQCLEGSDQRTSMGPGVVGPMWDTDCYSALLQESPWWRCSSL